MLRLSNKDSAAYQNQVNYLGNLGSSSIGTTYTFNNVNIGVAAADRVIVIAVALNSGGDESIDSATLGGNSMTRISGQTVTEPTALFRINVATGTTANIIITASDSVSGISFAIYSLVGWGTVFTYDTTATNGNQATIVSQINTAAGGAVIGIQNRASTSVISATEGFTGQNVNTVFDTINRVYVGTQFPTTTSRTQYSVTANAVTNSMTLASFSKPADNAMQYISTTTYEATTSLTVHDVPAPTVYNPGDLIVIFIASGSDQGQTLTNSGWTTIVNDYSSTAQNRMFVAYRTAGSEPSTYGVTQAAARGLVAACVVLRNATSVGDLTSVSSASSSGLPVSITPFDSARDGILYYSSSNSTANKVATPPTGYTEIAELYTGVTFSATNLQIAYRVPNSGQSTSNVTNLWGGTDRIRSALFDFRNV
jgi:hypothetical protein